MALQSPLDIKKLKENVRSLGLSVTRVKKSAITSSKLLMNKTKVKRASVFEGRRLFDRKKQSIRIKNQENIIEASKLTAPIKRGAAAIARSTQGFLGRILDFTATLLTGWLLYNLPTLIAMAKELMGRITRMVDLLKGFVSNLGNIMGGFGNVLKASAQNIMSFDFTDNSKRVDKAMKDLNASFEDMGAQIDEGLELLTTPLSEGLTTGENAPDFGTKFPAQPEGGAQPSPSGGRFTGSGVSKGVQIAKRLQQDLGLKDYQASAVVGNLLNESSQLNPAQIENGGSGLLTEAMRKGTGYGWVQWTDPGRQRKLYALAQKMGVDPSKEPLTDEINYAMLVSELPTYDSGGRFRSSRNLQEASNWLLEQYFKPRDRGSREQRERIEDSQKVLKGLSQTPTPTTPTPTKGITTTVKDEINVAGPRGGTPLVGLTPGQGFGAARRGRTHQGIDIGTSGQKGYFVSLRKTGRVDFVGSRGGYGIMVDIIGPDGTCYRFAHLAKAFVRKGETYNGQTIGEIGNIGSSSGIHLHFEVRPGGPYAAAIDPRPYLGLLSIGRQLTGIAGQPVTITASTPTPAQVSAAPQQRRQQLPGQLTPERRGQEIVLIDDVQPQQPAMPMGGGGGGGIIPIIINPLNSYIKNKLLLDLAYT